jgi:hypothetical protein
VTIQLNPSTLPDAQTYVYTSDYVEVVDVDEFGGMTVQSIANLISISFSTAQSNVTVNVGNNKIWFNGYYSIANTEGGYYTDPDDVVNSPKFVSNFEDVPQNKWLYRVDQPTTDGITVTHNITVGSNTLGNSSFTIDRFVSTNLYRAYNFLRSYQWYKVV